MTNVPDVEDHSSSRSTQRVIIWITRAVGYLLYAYLIFVEIILLLGFFLLLFGANPTSGFVQWAYRNLDRVMEPFRGIFSPIEIGQTANDVPAVFETSILFAMVVYGIVAILVSMGIHWLTGRINRLDREQQEEDRRRAYADAIRRTQSPVDPTLPQMPPDPYGMESPSTVPPTTTTTTTATSTAPTSGTAGTGDSPSVPPPPQSPGQPG